MFIIGGLGTTEVELAWILLHGECHPLKKHPRVEWYQLLLWS